MGLPLIFLNRATPLMLLAIGMTLVIATKGIDISVGSVIAISGAVAASLIGGKLEYVDGIKTLSYSCSHARCYIHCTLGYNFIRNVEWTINLESRNSADCCNTDITCCWSGNCPTDYPGANYYDLL